MTFDPRLLFDLSVSLADDTKYENESKYRTSVNRVYFAAFLASRTYLENSKKVKFTHSGKDHQIVIDKMNKCDPIVGGLLITLRENRKEADYVINKKVEQAFTRYSINCAQKVLEKVKGMK